MVHTVDLPALTQTFSPYLPKEDIHWDTRFALQKELRIIECDGNFVLYNTVLNNPIVLNQNARNAVSELDQKTLRELAQDPEHWEVAELLIEAFHLLPVPLNTRRICAVKNAEYLRSVADGRSIKMLDLRLSEACNFGCHHCIAHDANKSRIMSLDTAKSIVDTYIAFLQKHQPDNRKLSLHYGNCEPLMNFKVLRSVHEYCLARYPEFEVEAAVNTNLSLLTEEMAEYFTKSGIAVYTSLDGPPAGNDAIRVYRDGRGTYASIWEKMETLRKMGNPILGISVTINDKNFRYIDDNFIDWCADQGYLSVAYDFDLIHCLSLSTEQQVEFLAHNWQAFTARGIEFFGTWETPFLNFSNESIVEDRHGFCKAAIGRNLSVDSLQNVYLCGFHDDQVCSLNDLEAAIKPGGSFYQRIEERLVGNLPSPCLGCIFEGACNGQCLITGKHPEKLLPQCEFYQKMTEAMIRINASDEEDDA